MDSVKFEVFEEGPWEGYMRFILPRKTHFARTIINGRSILEYIKECEQPLIQYRAGRYMDQFAGVLYRYLTDMDYRLDGEIALLICDNCLEEECYPIYARIDETPNVVTWSNFYNPFICKDSSDENFKPYHIAPFHFARDEFEKAVRKLGEQLQGERE